MTNTSHAIPPATNLIPHTCSSLLSVNFGNGTICNWSNVNAPLLSVTKSRLEMCVQWEILLGGVSFVSLAGQHTFCFLLTKLWKPGCYIYKRKCLYLSYRAHIGWIYFCLLKKHEHLWKKKISQCSLLSWGHHPALTTNIFTSIWPIEDKQELWWPAKHTTERPA